MSTTLSRPTLSVKGNPYIFFIRTFFACGDSLHFYRCFSHSPERTFTPPGAGGPFCSNASTSASAAARKTRVAFSRCGSSRIQHASPRLSSPLPARALFPAEVHADSPAQDLSRSLKLRGLLPSAFAPTTDSRACPTESLALNRFGPLAVRSRSASCDSPRLSAILPNIESANGCCGCWARTRRASVSARRISPRATSVLSNQSAASGRLGSSVNTASNLARDSVLSGSGLALVLRAKEKPNR